MSVKPLPPNFKTIILDWTKDLSITFPEYAYLWSKWTNPDMTELEVRQLYDYCLTVYPERFFDILYQSAELFELFSTVNTCFLPGVEFKLLFNCPDVSENTTKTMWKYLQLVLFTVAGSIHDKSNFGESANLFEGLDEDELHTKLQDAITNMGDFFQNMTDQAPNQSSYQEHGQDGQETNESTTDKSTSQSLPDVDELHGHIKGLFDGKIGSLAKELAEEISGDMADILGKDCENMKSTADVLKNMMKNPTKITGLIKTVSDKLQQKMNSGEISQDELMKEATDIIGKMKGMGGGGKGMGNKGGGPMDGMGDFQEMFKNMAKGMGMNIPKNAKMDTNALDRMTQASSMKDRLRNKMADKKAKEEAAALEKAAILAEQAKNYKPFDFSDEKPCKPTKSVFKIEGDTVQQTSSIIRPTQVAVNSHLAGSSSDLTVTADSTTKKKKKKGKK